MEIWGSQLHSHQWRLYYSILSSVVTILLSMCGVFHFTVKRFRLLQPFFGHLSCIPSLCAWHIKFKKCKLRSFSHFVKLVSSFRSQPKPNQHFRWGLLFLCSYIHLLLESFLVACRVVVECQECSQIGLPWEKRLANVTKEEAPLWTFKRTYLVAFFGHTRATETT